MGVCCAFIPNLKDRVFPLENHKKKISLSRQCVSIGGFFVPEMLKML